jgi:hypothetical protein
MRSVAKIAAMATKKTASKNKSATRAASKSASPKKTSTKLSLIAQTVLNAKEAHARKGHELIARIQTRMQWIEESFYEVGVALQALRAPAVWSALGYETFEALIETLPNLSLQMAYRLLRIADHYEESTAIALTQSKALALLSYVEATPEADDAESLARSDAKVAGVPISKQTVRGILEAASEARPAAKKRPGEAEARARGTKLERALEALTEEAVSVRIVHRKGAFRAVLDIPAALLDALTKKAR